MLRYFLVVAAIFGMGVQAQAGSSRVGERADALLREVKDDGLAAVVRRTSDPLGLSLLDMMADVMGEHDVAHEISRSFKASAPRFLLEGASIARGLNGAPVELQRNVQSPPPDQQSYRGFFENLSGETLSEVIVFWRSPGVPIAGSKKEETIPTGEGRLFNMGRCDLMVSYVVGVFANGQRILRLPPEGQEMTPELASKLHPNDNDPCADSWALTAHPVP